MQKNPIITEQQTCDNFCNALYAYERVHCFMSFVIIDDYQTANEYLGEIVFAQDTDQKVIGQRMINEYEKECSRLYNTGMKTF